MTLELPPPSPDEPTFEEFRRAIQSVNLMERLNAHSGLRRSAQMLHAAPNLAVQSANAEVVASPQTANAIMAEISEQMRELARVMPPVQLIVPRSPSPPGGASLRYENSVIVNVEPNIPHFEGVDLAAVEQRIIAQHHTGPRRYGNGQGQAVMSGGQRRGMAEAVRAFQMLYNGGLDLSGIRTKGERLEKKVRTDQINAPKKEAPMGRTYVCEMRMDGTINVLGTAPAPPTIQTATRISYRKMERFTAVKTRAPKAPSQDFLMVEVIELTIENEATRPKRLTSLHDGWNGPKKFKALCVMQKRDAYSIPGFRHIDMPQKGGKR